MKTKVLLFVLCSFLLSSCGIHHINMTKYIHHINMTKYRLKTKKSGKSNDSFRDMCKEIESGVADSNKSVSDAAVNTYKAIENGVVGTYKKIENGVVKTYNKIEKKFVDKFLEEVPDEE